jgi:hypothetical protein
MIHCSHLSHLVLVVNSLHLARQNAECETIVYFILTVLMIITLNVKILFSFIAFLLIYLQNYHTVLFCLKLST